MSINRTAISSDGANIELRLEDVWERPEDSGSAKREGRYHRSLSPRTTIASRIRLVVEADGDEIKLDRLLDLVGSRLDEELARATPSSSSHSARHPPSPSSSPLRVDRLSSDDGRMIFEFPVPRRRGRLLERIAGAIASSELRITDYLSQQLSAHTAEGDEPAIYPVKVGRAREAWLASSIAGKALERKKPIYAILTLDTWKGYVLFEARNPEVVDSTIRGSRYVMSPVTGMMHPRDIKKFLVPEYVPRGFNEIAISSTDRGDDQESQRERMNPDKAARPGRSKSPKRGPSSGPRRG